MFRLKGSILSMSFLDCNGALIPYSYEPWKDDNRGNDGSRRDREFFLFTASLLNAACRVFCNLSYLIFCYGAIQIGTPTKGNNRMSPTLGGSDSFSDRQFIAITSEKSARVIALPSQNCVYRQQIADTDYVVKAEIISFKGNTYTHIVESIGPVSNMQFHLSFKFQIAFVLFVISQPVIWLRTVCQVFGH